VDGLESDQADATADEEDVEEEFAEYVEPGRDIDANVLMLFLFDGREGISERPIHESDGCPVDKDHEDIEEEEDDDDVGRCEKRLVVLFRFDQFDGCDGVCGERWVEYGEGSSGRTHDKFDNWNEAGL
jgi:hypothetical protein